MKTRKLPLRKCLGCNEQKDKRELIRVVRTKEGEINLDATGKSQGRGAYICPNEECMEKAIKRKSLERAFSTKINDEIYAKLREEIKKHEK